MSALDRFEAASDAAFLAFTLPHPNIYVAAWYLLTVSEDSQRLLLCMPGESVDETKVEHYQDRFKFSLRSCLSRVWREAKDWTPMPLPQHASARLYVRARELLLAGIDYSVAAQICSSAHNESARVLEAADHFRIEVVEDLLDKRYGALEAMRQSAGEVLIPFSALFWFWIREEAHRPAAVWQVMESTRLHGRRIRYEYDPELAYQLSQVMPQPQFLIPDDWVFTWGGRQETTLLLNALSLRVLYHLVAVHFGAQKFRLKGGAEHDLCLVLAREDWVRDLDLMSQLPQGSIEQFVGALTYGNGTQSPDQALQPLVPLGGSRLGLAPLGWLSSNVERNLLSLQARLEPRDFNRQSHLFEKRMTATLHDVIRTKWPLVVANRTFSLPGAREEFDLLICEPVTRTVAVMELRWMLSPADPREVQQRKSACWEKVEQVQRKAQAAAKNLHLVLQSAFGLSIDAQDEWTVRAVVVIEGFGGAKSLSDAVPVVPEWVLEAGARVAPSLRRLVEWAQQLEWLPVEGRDFKVIDSESHLDNVKVRYPGLVPLRTGRDLLPDATLGLSQPPR